MSPAHGQDGPAGRTFLPMPSSSFDTFRRASRNGIGNTRRSMHAWPSTLRQLQHGLRGALIATLFGVTACSESAPEPVTPLATVTAGPTTFTLFQGGAQDVIYYAERMGGHNSAIGLSVSNVPPGLLAVFKPAIIPGPAALVSTFTVSVAPSAQPGTYTLQTQVTGSGVEDTTIAVTVTVIAPGIGLSVGQATASLAQGESASIPVTATRSGGYTGPIGLAAVGLPEGVTATFTPSTLQGEQLTATLTLSASLDVTLGTSTVSVRAAGAGVLEQASPVQVTVTPATTPAILLEALTPILDLRAGQSLFTDIRVRRFAGFDGPVTFMVENPGPFTVSFSDPTEDEDLVRMHITAPVDITLGARVLKVHASGAGIAPAQTSIQTQVLPHPDFTIAPWSAVSESMQGSPNVLIMGLSVTRIGGHVRPITLSVDGLPSALNTDPGMHGYMFDPPTNIIQGLGFRTNVPEDAPPGDHVVSVRATDDENRIRTTQFLLTIRARGTYTLAATPLAVTAARGGTAQSSVAVTRSGGFSGTITFSLAAAPPGIIGTFTPGATTADASQLTVTVGPDVPPGKYIMYIRGTSPGADSVDTPFEVTVTQ